MTSPRVARWILERLLPSEVRDDVSGDVEEMFRRMGASQGWARARLWYWRQVVSFASRFLAHRIGARWKQKDMSTGISWLDCKLGIRMLARYPGLTLVAVVGMAVAIAISAAAFSFVGRLLDPSLPLEDGGRIVALQNWDTAANNPDNRTVHDFVVWRDELKSVVDVSAFRRVGRNLIAHGGAPETVDVTQMTASGFRVARVAPLLGRPLLDEDERADAAPVVVIGHDLWQKRFGGDPGILGRSLQLGDTMYAVVGVMPAGFKFPVSDRLWVPLRVNPSEFERRTGPRLNVFARLAPGVTTDGAQAELTIIGQRGAAAFPKTHAQLRPRVVPYTYPFSDMDDPDNALAVRVMQALVNMLLAIVCLNVAILVYARTATRQGEIAVRTALGASRRRIVAQLFVEALVLAGLAAVAGLAIVSVALTQVDAALRPLAGELPFWMDFTLSPAAVAYVLALAVAAAAIVGVVPALKATGRRVQHGLQGLSAGSGARMQMGRTWTMLIVAQVAFAVALLPATVFRAWQSISFRTGDPGFAAREFLTAEIVTEAAAASRNNLEELWRRLEAEPAVADVTFAMAHPGEEAAAVIDVEGVAIPAKAVQYNIVAGSKAGHLVRFNRVEPGFFDAFDVSLLTGTGFRSGSDGIVVNRAFVQHILGGGDALGRRVRYVGQSREASVLQGVRAASRVELDRWYEIVGVVNDFPPYAMDRSPADARLYHAAAPRDIQPGILSVRVRVTPAGGFADRLREISAAVDPNLQLLRVAAMDDVLTREQGVMRAIAATLVLLTLSVVLLSAAGIYALMSFTVARRRKEIGIRVALGADRQRILQAIFKRAIVQLAIGAALGVTSAAAMEVVTEGETLEGTGAVVVPLVAAFMMIVGLLAALGPARRGLRIDPTEALREE
jgi:predicted permease